MYIYIYVCMLISVIACRVYNLLNVIEFNSTRKRMSVIVKNEEGKLVLLCKGADRFVIDSFISCYCFLNRTYESVINRYLLNKMNDAV